jgi:two-component system phosphate regulon response regulator PhoB
MHEVTMAAIKVLVVEDESAIRDMLAFTLQTAGMEVLEAPNAEQGWQLAQAHQPSIILLDWMLPGVPGVSLLARLKTNDKLRHVPVIMLTARAEESDQVQGFETGADDYVTKPFSPRALLARIQALLRRLDEGQSSDNLQAGRMLLDSQGHRVSIDGVEVKLGPKEYRLLAFFMAHHNRVFTRHQLLDEVWGDRVVVEDRTIDVHIRRLRRALEDHHCDSYIQTVRGSGYRFSVTES